MILQADSVPIDTILKADVCIVGGGAAGLSAALKLADSSLRVVLLESGQFKFSAETQRLYEGSVSSDALHSPLDKFRQRRFGGSTNIWGGRCAPLDPVDFLERPYIPDSGWPIGHADLLPHYPEANALAEAGSFEYDANDPANRGMAALIDGFRHPDIRTDGLERFSCPTNFAARYHERLAAAPNIDIYLGANVTRIHLVSDGSKVKNLEVATLGGNRFTVQSNAQILAMGGLENVRLLLASRGVSPQGVGNDHDVVGRYYMSHIAGHVGKLTLSTPVSAVHHGYVVSRDGIYTRRRIALTADAQQRLGVTNLIARLHFPQPSDPAHRNGVLSAIFLARRLISFEYSRRLSDAQDEQRALLKRHLRNVLVEFPDIVHFLTHWLFARKLSDRKFPSVILKNKSNQFSLDVHAEQVPIRDSRITVGKDFDRLGMPKMHVDWKYDAQDIRSIGQSLDLIGQAFQASGTGTFEYDRHGLEHELTKYGAYGGHHLGTTRMGTDRATSVVDADCQVHGIDGLHIAGGSVFTTSSQANPTLSIIALSIRLAAHIAARAAVKTSSIG
ncbi:FAD-dependent oxidoreductase [Xylophilus sp. Kf1]|nr:FAD-dependent oxidoreductase [Xylophilus sp. Kf1]